MTFCKTKAVLKKNGSKGKIQNYREMVENNMFSFAVIRLALTLIFSKKNGFTKDFGKSLVLKRISVNLRFVRKLKCGFAHTA